MGGFDNAAGRVAARRNGNFYKEKLIGISLRHTNRGTRKIAVDGRDLIGADIFQHFQLRIRFANGDAGCGCRFQSVEVAGIGYDNAFDILDNIAADGNIHRFRQHAKCLSGLGCSIGHCNGFSTAESGAKLLSQHPYTVFIYLVFHKKIPLFFISR